MIDFTKFLVKSLLWCLFLTFVFQNISKLYWGYNYELSVSPDRAWHAVLDISEILYNPQSFWRGYCAQEFMPSVINLTIAFVAMFNYKFLKIKGCALIDRFFNIKPIENIVHIFSRHVTAKNLCLFFIQLIVLIELADKVESLTWYASHDLAHVIDGFGAYELGERVFSLRSEDDLGRTLASTCGSYNGHDHDLQELKSERLNKCVAELYGSESRQMANRFAILGGHLSKMEQFAESSKYRRKAIQLYKQLNKPDHIVQNLGFLAFNQVEQRDKTGAKASITEAIDIVDISEASWTTKLEHLMEVFPAAYSLDKKWAEDIRSGRVLRITPQVNEHFMHCSGPKQAFAK